MQLAGDEFEFSCEGCPEGMEGSGMECYDLNECILPSSDSRKHNCTQTCENIVGKMIWSLFVLFFEI